jgi:hypothetical protein
VREWLYSAGAGGGRPWLSRTAPWLIHSADYGGFGPPEEIAWPAEWLASRQGHPITGQDPSNRTQTHINIQYIFYRREETKYRKRNIELNLATQK